MIPLAALALALGCGPGRMVRRGLVNEDAVAVVRQDLQLIRGLAFTASVPVLAMSPDEIAATLARDLELSYRPGELEHLATIYTRLGLLPSGTELRPALQQLYQQEGAGFYDPRTKRLMLATRALGAGGIGMGLFTMLTGRDLVGGFLVAHELTHALQDQHYGLPTTPEPLTAKQSDRLLARHALLEGDATLAGFAYVLGGRLDPGTIGQIEQKLHEIPRDLATRYPATPEILRAALAFQYDAGTTFAGWALTAGGWAELDRVQTDPPDSTEQVLHPARYYATRERPVEIALAGTEELEQAGWARTFEDTFGEFAARVLARRFLPHERADRVADGWGGDRLRALARGSELTLVWMTAWDTPSEAIEFAEALPELVADARLERREERVLVLIAPPGVDVTGLAGRIWSRSEALRPSPPPGEARRGPLLPARFRSAARCARGEWDLGRGC